MSDRRDHLPDRQRILLRKLKVAFIVSRNTHHRARAVFHQHIVRYPDGNRLAAEGIDREQPVLSPSFLFLADFAAGRSLSVLIFSANAIDVALQR